MRPRTLSATASHVYEMCPARYKASHIDYVPDLSSTAADLGKVCHLALENYVKDGHHLVHAEALPALLALYDAAYYTFFSDAAQYEDGKGLIIAWHARQDWTDRTVLSTEQKEFFELPTPGGGKIKFNYVMDRVDRHANGDVEVVDYKTSGFPVNPTDLRDKVQGRAYALAAQLKYPDAERIWVSFDMLRFDGPVGVVFTKEQNRETYRYLKRLVERIWEDEEAPEVLNSECRWCVRKTACKKLRLHVNGGGVLSIGDPVEAAKQREELLHAKGAITKQLDQLDEYLMGYLEQNDVFEIELGDVIVEAAISGRRYVNAEQAAEIIGPELLARHGNLTVSAVEGLLKGGELTPEQKSALRRTIGKNKGAPSIKTHKKKKDS